MIRPWWPERYKIPWVYPSTADDSGQPLVGQKLIHRYASHCHHRLLVGGDGAGKSRCGATEAIRMGLVLLGSTGLILTPRVKSLERVVVPRLEFVLRRLSRLSRLADPYFGMLSLERGEMNLWGGTKVYLRSVYPAPQVLGGLKPDWLWFDDSDDCAWPASVYVDRLFADARADPDFIPVCHGGFPRYTLITTGMRRNPRGIMPFFQARLRAGDPDFVMVRMPSTQNTHLPQSFLEDLRESLPPDDYAMRVECHGPEPAPTVVRSGDARTP